MSETVQTEFETAVAVARLALERFNEAPLVDSKWAAPRISSWWRVYREASELAVRWHRELRAIKPAEIRWLDTELDRPWASRAGSEGRCCDLAISQIGSTGYLRRDGEHARLER
jgi:hypothetical protein